VSVHTGHTDWCARGHHCGLGEHRASPITVAFPRAGTGVLTRVGDSNGRQYAEIRMRVALPSDDAKARRQLIALLTRLPGLVEGPKA